MAQRAQSRHRRPRPTSRHRRRRHPARAIGLATAPLVAVVPVVASASLARGATMNTWDRLANCESSGRWHINTGNGFYGGVQFNDATWDAYRHGQFASRADLATKTEQVIVAERLLDARGWAPWPACSARLGLGSAAAKGSPFTADQHFENAGASSGSTSSGATATSSSLRAGSPTRIGPGKHRRPVGLHVYQVRRGDTLSAIARRMNVPGGWQAIYRINRHTIGHNPNLILVGERLSLPRR
jgi:resuscitation-promoting factor RpfA